MMLKVIEEFLKRTGIKPETFGLLTINDQDMVFRLRRSEYLSDDEWGHVLMFIQKYDEIKGW